MSLSLGSSLASKVYLGATEIKGAYLGATQVYTSFVSLLDLYPAKAAYSAYDLGNKRGSVTESEGTVVNPVQRWRRGSDGALQMFTAEDIDDGTALTWAGTTAYLLTAYDQSGNDHDLTQTTAANQPLVVSGGALTVDANGNVAPSFDGTDDYLTTSSSVLTVGELSVFSVASSDSDESYAGVWAEQGTDASRENHRIVGALHTKTLPNARHTNYAPDGTNRFVNLTSKLSTSTVYQLTSVSDGVNLDGLVDGSSQGSVSIGGAFVDPTVFQLGRQLAGSFHLNGNIAAVIAYNADQTANRAAIEAKLSTIVTTAIS